MPTKTTSNRALLFQIVLISLTACLCTLAFTACSGEHDTHKATDTATSDDTKSSTDPTDSTDSSDETNNHDHSADSSEHADMDHSSDGSIPEGLATASSPKFKVGSKATITAGDDHMSGMKGATATIVGAFDTTAYIVSYTPVGGGKPVKGHKWFIHEELSDASGATSTSGASKQSFKPGDQVTLNAEHMPGQKGAKATIDSAEQTTVYMIDFVTTTDGKSVKNHKWVTEAELR